MSAGLRICSRSCGSASSSRRPISSAAFTWVALASATPLTSYNSSKVSLRDTWQTTKTNQQILSYVDNTLTGTTCTQENRQQLGVAECTRPSHQHAFTRAHVHRQVAQHRRVRSPCLFGRGGMVLGRCLLGRTRHGVILVWQSIGATHAAPANTVARNAPATPPTNLQSFAPIETLKQACPCGVRPGGAGRPTRAAAYRQQAEPFHVDPVHVVAEGVVEGEAVIGLVGHSGG